MTFRYFADPHRFSTYQANPHECDLCHQLRPGYADAFFVPDGERDIKFVCEPDLAAGKLLEIGAQVNNGDRFELLEQAAVSHPEWTEAEVDDYVLARNRELETATPSIVTWQDYAWPVHCADYMRFIKEIGQADCIALGDGDGRAFFEKALDSTYKEGDPQEVYEYVGELWEAMRPDAPQDNTSITTTSFYLFQCLTCGDYVIEWDADDVTGAGDYDPQS